jgi:hypothetical protein
MLRMPETTLLAVMTRDTDSRGLLIAERLGAVAFVTVLTAAAAQISVPLPFTPVPFTFQPMVVLLGAMALGSRLGAASQVLYLTLGVLGVPVFAASPLPQGIGRLIGPTGGYLMAYPAAAFVAGWLAERGLDRRYLTSVAACALRQSGKRRRRRPRRRTLSVHCQRSRETAPRGSGHAAPVGVHRPPLAAASARASTSR